MITQNKAKGKGLLPIQDNKKRKGWEGFGDKRSPGEISGWG
jgi:hypothetical protein